MTIYQLIPLIVAVPLIVFWLWMFREMAQDEDLPPNTRSIWLIAFVLLNFIAAAYYYFTQYRGKHGQA